MLLVTHSMALAHQCDRVIVVRDGRIVQDGTPEVLDAKAGTFRELSDAGRPRMTGRWWSSRRDARRP